MPSSVTASRTLPRSTGDMSLFVVAVLFSTLLGNCAAANERTLATVPVGDVEAGTPVSADVPCGEFLSDLSFAGNDLGVAYESEDFETCLARCYRTSGCGFAVQLRNGNCNMESASDQTVEVVDRPGAMSVKLCEDEIAPIVEDFNCGVWKGGVDFNMNDLGEIAVADRAECEAGSLAIPAANGAVYNRGQMRCWPKSLPTAGNAYLHIDENFQSIRFCPGD